MINLAKNIIFLSLAIPSISTAADLICIGDFICGSKHTNPLSLQFNRCLQLSNLKTNITMDTQKFDGLSHGSIKISGIKGFLSFYLLYDLTRNEAKFLHLEENGGYTSGILNRFTGDLTIAKFDSFKELDYLYKAECKTARQLF